MSEGKCFEKWNWEDILEGQPKSSVNVSSQLGLRKKGVPNPLI